MRKLILVLLCGFLFTGLIFGKTQKHGTAKEAIALSEKGLAYYKENGQEKAFQAFSDTNGQFVQGDLYLFVVDFNGLVFAHGGNNGLIGKNMMELKDPDGKLFIKDFIELAKTKGKGWDDYKWTNPVTKKIQAKSTYIVRLEDKDMFIGCGIYK